MSAHKTLPEKLPYFNREAISCPRTGLIVILKNHEKTDLLDGNISKIGVFIWDINAVVNDADARNSAFLNLIKSKFTE